MVKAQDIKNLRKRGLTVKRLDKNWIEGSYKNLAFQAQIFDEGSKFGVGGAGKTSRLLIKSNGKTLASFERGWNKKPQDPNAQKLTQILSLRKMPKKRR